MQKSWSIGPADVESQKLHRCHAYAVSEQVDHGDQIPRLMLTSKFEASVKCLPSRTLYHTTDSDAQGRHVGWTMTCHRPSYRLPTTVQATYDCTGYLRLYRLPTTKDRLWEGWWTRHSGSFAHNLGRVCVWGFTLLKQDFMGCL